MDMIDRAALVRRLEDRLAAARGEAARVTAAYEKATYGDLDLLQEREFTVGLVAGIVDVIGLVRDFGVRP